MKGIIGIIVVLGSIIAGYMMEKGNLSILIQPAELIIIGGAAVGALMIMAGNRFGMVLRHISVAFQSDKTGKKAYMELLLLLNHLFSKAQREGLIALESHLDNPKKSDIFSRYPGIISNVNILAFVTDNIRLIITASMSAHDLENLLDIDMETQHNEELYVPTTLTRIADSLPGLGIVAAVLGVTLAMGKITEPPEVLGHTVAAALVGTFLGVLLCYGIVGPIANNIEGKVKDTEVYFTAIKMALLGFSQGSHPLLAVEAGRRAIPTRDRPTFSEVDEEIRKWKEKK
jgi:chemotaxis protein MotA